MVALFLFEGYNSGNVECKGVSALNLFNRTITVSVHTQDEKHVIVDGVFIDSNHELVLSMTVNIEDLKVLDSSGELRRAPHQDCLETANWTKSLIGLDLTRNVRKQVIHAVGGEKGCTHFEELALECIKGIKQAMFALMKMKMPFDEVHSKIYEMLEGKCHHFRKKDKVDSNNVAR